jgi:hypothetical protein
MGRKSIFSINSDGFKVYEDGPKVQWPMKPQAFDPKVAKLCENSIKEQVYWLKVWETDPMALNQYRKGLQAFNRGKLDPFFKKGMIGSTASAETVAVALKKYETSGSEADLKVYVNLLGRAKCQEFLVGAATSKDMAIEKKSMIITIASDRIMELDARKAAKLSK